MQTVGCRYLLLKPCFGMMTWWYEKMCFFSACIYKIESNLLHCSTHKWVFSFLSKQSEITLALQGCEQSVWLSLTYFFHFFSSPIFFSLSCLPLSFCLSVTFSSLFFSGPQNKDSRESLPYDGEEKEVRENLFKHRWCVTHSLSSCHVV